MNIQELQTERLDINNKYNVELVCKQFDDVILKIIVYDKSLPADLSNYNVRLKAFKADQVPLIQNTNITIKDNTVTIKADKQLTTTNGIVKAELQFINKTTLEKKSTFYLNIEVVASVLIDKNIVSTPTCTLLEELDNKLDEIENIGNVLEEAKDVRDTLTNTTIPGANSINSALVSNIKNADTKKKEVENIISNASDKIVEVNKSITDANTSKSNLDKSKINADTTKENLDAANTLAENNIEELNSLGNVTDLAKNVQTNTTDITNLKENVENNTSYLKDCAKNIDNIKDGTLPVGAIKQHDLGNDKDMNNIDLFKIGKMICLYYQEKTNQTPLHTPYGDLKNGYDVITWYNVITFGTVDRITQIATSPFSHNNGVFIRYKHDSYWSKWIELATTERTKVIATPGPEKIISRQNIYIENKTLYLDVTIQRVNNIEFELATHLLFSIPPTGINYIRTLTASHWSDTGLTTGSGSATILSNGEVYIINQERNSKTIRISATFALEGV